MSQLTLTRQQVRKIILNAAGLARQAQFGTGIEAVYDLINHLGFVQLDTNFVVERAHHHTIAARVPDYEPRWLEELQADGRIFEFFTSDSGYIPMLDFRFSLCVKQAFSAQRKVLTPAERSLMSQILDRIEREGPLMVKDFENDRQQASLGWWDWRPSKIALERLYMDGSLMITRKKDFRKIYELPADRVPYDIDTTLPTAEEFARYIIKRTLGALGIAYVKDIAWRAHYVKGNVVKKELEKMVTEGEINTVIIDGVKSATLYMLPHQDVDVEIAGDAFILSPFDILNVYRHRLRDFFDFDYQIECFVPEPKRKYGYFSLPILIGDVFVARMDSKAERKQFVLTVNNLHFEDVDLSQDTLAKLIIALQNFARFNQCRNIVIKKCNREHYLNTILAGL